MRCWISSNSDLFGAGLLDEIDELVLGLPVEDPGFVAEVPGENLTHLERLEVGSGELQPFDIRRGVLRPGENLIAGLAGRTGFFEVEGQRHAVEIRDGVVERDSVLVLVRTVDVTHGDAIDMAGAHLHDGVQVALVRPEKPQGSVR